MAGDLEFTHEGGESFADIRRRVAPGLRGAAPFATAARPSSSSPTAS